MPGRGGSGLRRIEAWLGSLKRSEAVRCRLAWTTQEGKARVHLLCIECCPVQACKNALEYSEILERGAAFLLQASSKIESRDVKRKTEDRTARRRLHSFIAKPWV